VLDLSNHKGRILYRSKLLEKVYNLNGELLTRDACLDLGLPCGAASYGLEYLDVFEVSVSVACPHDAM
jgi:hypothetical protein